MTDNAVFDGIDAAVRRFQANWHRYDAAAGQVREEVWRLADGAHIKATVTSRAKDVRSFQKKIITKQYYEDPWGRVTDKCGVRVVVHSTPEVDLLCRELDTAFGDRIRGVEDKRQVVDPERLAYGGIHMQVVAQPASQDYEAIECEVQIRTTAQDAWSVISHRYLYKPVLDLPVELQHAVYRLVALVELFDQEVERVIAGMENLGGSTVASLLRPCEDLFVELANSPSNREMTVAVLETVVKAIPLAEIESYPARLENFAQEHRETLRSLYRQYGAHSDVAYAPEYLLFGQAESIVILERLNTRMHDLLSVWSGGSLPFSYLEALADAAAIPLPGAP